MPNPAQGTLKGASGKEPAVAGERVEDAVDVFLDVVEVQRDAEVRVAGGGDDPLGGERLDERVRVDGGDAQERSELARATRRRHRRPELVETGEEALHEPA